MEKYVLYIRKSSESEERQIMSLDAQENEMKRIAERDELNVVEIIRESHSAKKADMRPEFNRMIAGINSGLYNSILTWAPDRLSRNAGDLGKLVDLMDSGKLITVKTYSQEFKNDPNSKFMLMMLCSQAKLENDQKSLNVKRGNREKLKRGDWINRAPFGYINEKVTKTIAVDTARAPYVQKIFEMYSTGLHGHQSISTALFEQGLRTSSGKKVYKSGIQKILTSSFYCGIMESNSTQYLGNHEPLISSELFDKCQEVCAKKSKPRSKTLSFALSGFITCANCGCAITAELKKAKYVYYHCTNGKGICDQRSFNANETELHKQITLDLNKLKISQRMIDIVYKAKLEEVEHSKGTQDHSLEDAQKALKTLATRKSRLVDTYTEGDIDVELYRAKLKEIDNESVRLTKRIQELEKKAHDPLVTIELIYSKFKQGNSLADEYKHALPARKRELLSEALSNSTLLNRNIQQVSYKSPYNIFALAPLNPTFQEMLAE
ncbi:MAG: recombinase family protein [Candidatus Paceibacterota bacterium]